MISNIFKDIISIIRDLIIKIYWHGRSLIKKDLRIYTKIKLIFRKKKILMRFVDFFNTFFVLPTKIISARIYGRLGNQLFQLANALAYSWKYNLIPHFKITPKKDRWWQEYWSTIFRRLTAKKLLPSKLTIYKEELISEYQEIPKPRQIIDFKNHNGIIFYGYFQCAKYFDEYREKLLQHLYYIAPSERIFLKKKYPEIFLSEKITIGVHIRRGDYINLSEYTNLSDTNYYQKSIAYFQNKLGVENLKIIIFSDDPNWCKKYMKIRFPEINPLYPHEKDYLDLYLMSCCQHQIIANSTYSWWAAYLNNFPKKIIVAPKNWYSSQIPHKSDHYYMDSWIKM